MSLVDKLKEIIATVSDGAHHALLHLAGEVDKLKEDGLGAKDGAGVIEAIGAKVEAKVDAFLIELRADLTERLVELEGTVAALKAAAVKDEALPEVATAGATETAKQPDGAAPQG